MTYFYQNSARLTKNILYPQRDYYVWYFLSFLCSSFLLHVVPACLFLSRLRLNAEQILAEFLRLCAGWKAGPTKLTSLPQLAGGFVPPMAWNKGEGALSDFSNNGGSPREIALFQLSLAPSGPLLFVNSATSRPSNNLCKDPFHPTRNHLKNFYSSNKSNTAPVSKHKTY